MHGMIKKLKRTVVFILKLALFASLFGIFFGIFGMNNPWLFNLSRTTGVTMVTFVVLNTASLQILPTTNAYLRLAAGSKEPMEILPAVWLASTVSICVGVFMSRALRGRKQRRELGG